MTKPVEQFVPAKKFDKKLFEQIELKILREVYDRFKIIKKRKQSLTKSHKEKGWIENEKKSEDISYQKYAFEIKSL